MPATTTAADKANADKGETPITPSFDASRPTAREKEMYNRTLALYQTGDPYYEEEPEGLSEAESNRWFREYQKKNEQHEARQMAIVAKEFGVSVADVEANWRKCSVYAGSIGKIEEPLLPAD